MRKFTLFLIALAITVGVLAAINIGNDAKIFVDAYCRPAAQAYTKEDLLK